MEQMLAGMDEKYIREVIEGEEKERSHKGKTVIKMRKFAAAAAVCIFILGAGISVGAATSSAFRDWIRENFLGHEITKVDVDLAQEKDMGETADLPLDKDAHLSLAEDMEIFGEKESFVCQYHREGDDEVIDQVYSIQDNGLKKMEIKSFQGKYDEVDFAFQYVIINQEILGFNTSGDINEVFHYVDGDYVYADLCELEKDTYVKGCIARLNLKTGEVAKLTDDKTIGNMMMSPNGKVILINYRADGYWSVFDVASRTKKRVNEINGYAHTNEIVFKGDYQVLTYGDTYMKGDVELTGTKVIDLRTGERTASYKECGDYGPEWLYEQKKGKLVIRNVEGTASITIATGKDYQGYPHPISFRGDYVLLGNLEEEGMPYYLCNLKEKTYMEIDAFSGFQREVELYLAAKEGKMLLTDGKEAYLVTVG